MPTLAEKSPVARKVHDCNLCAGQIKIGESYVSQKVKDDDGVYTFKMHVGCRNLTVQMNMFDEGQGITEDFFQEYVKDKFSKISNLKGNFQFQLKTVMAFYLNLGHGAT